MSSLILASASSVAALSSLPEGARGVVVEIRAARHVYTDRLMALGVTPGARVTVLQRFPGIVFLCDQTELAVERSVADGVLVRVLTGECGGLPTAG
jgi:Fe2+ transport system protein FeoA